MVFFILNKFVLFLVVLGLCCYAGFSLVVVSGGHSLLVLHQFLIGVLLLLLSMGSGHAGFSSCGVWALEHRLSSFDPGV